jgi:hypothetical protein
MNTALDEMARVSITDALGVVALAVQRGDLALSEVLTALQAELPNLTELYSLHFLAR